MIKKIIIIKFKDNFYIKLYKILKKNIIVRNISFQYFLNLSININNYIFQFNLVQILDYLFLKLI